jgi:hypothetical protein
LGGVGTSSSKNIGINNTKPMMEKNFQGSLLWRLLWRSAKNNKMRLVGQNSNFYKMNNSYKRNEVTSCHRAWLNIYNAEGV